MGLKGERGPKGDNGTVVILTIYNDSVSPIEVTWHREKWECRALREKRDLKDLMEILA